MKEASIGRNIWYHVNREPHLMWHQIADIYGLTEPEVKKLFLIENRQYVWESWVVAVSRLWELMRNYWKITSGHPRLKGTPSE